jgi:hypothetical protein
MTARTHAGKSNIFGLGWRHVICPLAKHADAVSWITFGLFLLLIVAALYCKFAASGAESDFYQENYAAFWYGAWGLLVISTIGPMFNLAVERREVPLGVLIGVGAAHVLVFILMSVVVLIQSGKVEAVTGLLAAVAAAVMVGIGWVVQYQSGAKASRRAHTFSVLMQSRLSAEFQSHIAKRIRHYPGGTPVPPNDAKLIYLDGLVDAENQIQAQLAKDLVRTAPEHRDELRQTAIDDIAVLRSKAESLQSLKYLLNFYEFICAGLRMKELDEPLLRATLSDVAVGLYIDSLHVRLHAQSRQPDAYTELDKRIHKGVWLEVELVD